jgi:hypothetical protein
MLDGCRWVRPRHAPVRRASNRRALSLLAVAGAAAWLGAQSTLDLAHGNALAHEPQTAALVRELHVGTMRVDAVPQYCYWESCELSVTVLLARGWGAAARHRRPWSGLAGDPASP